MASMLFQRSFSDANVQEGYLEPDVGYSMHRDEVVNPIYFPLPEIEPNVSPESGPTVGNSRKLDDG